VLAATNSMNGSSDFENFRYILSAEDISKEYYSTETVAQALQALKDEATNIREVAEGKCNTYVLSYNDTIASCKSACNNNSYFYVYNLQDEL
jgi:hypothetical protein